MQIQVAKALGAEVATTVRSAEKAEFAKSIGADLVINTREELALLGLQCFQALDASLETHA